MRLRDVELTWTQAILVAVPIFMLASATFVGGVKLGQAHPGLSIECGDFDPPNFTPPKVTQVAQTEAPLPPPEFPKVVVILDLRSGKTIVAYANTPVALVLVNPPGTLHPIQGATSRSLVEAPQDLLDLVMAESARQKERLPRDP